MQIYRDNLVSNETANVIIDGEHKVARRRDALHAHLDWLANEFCKLDVRDSSLLEVGAGELTTLAPVAGRISEPTLAVHASELSWSRCRIGRDFANSLGVNLSSLTSASVTALPFASNSIDFVYTHFCLEELAGYEREAVKELFRVARRAVLLIEASYELGSLPQRRKLRNRCWNVGLLSAVKSLGYRIIRHELLPFSADPFHHGSIIQIEKTTTDPKPSFVLVCPRCKSELRRDKVVYFCGACQVVFPILDGIPVFIHNNAVIASYYGNIMKD